MSSIYRKLRDPIWKPAYNVYGDHSQHQIGDLPVRTFLFFGLIFRPDRLQLFDHQPIKHQNETQGNSETEEERIQYENFGRSGGFVCRIAGEVAPLYDARFLPIEIDFFGVLYDGYYEEYAESPSKQ